MFPVCCTCCNPTRSSSENQSSAGIFVRFSDNIVGRNATYSPIRYLGQTGSEHASRHIPDASRAARVGPAAGGSHLAVPKEAPSSLVSRDRIARAVAKDFASRARCFFNHRGRVPRNIKLGKRRGKLGKPLMFLGGCLVAKRVKGLAGWQGSPSPRRKSRTKKGFRISALPAKRARKCQVVGKVAGTPGTATVGARQSPTGSASTRTRPRYARIA
jgi:hypothetical protein